MDAPPGDGRTEREQYINLAATRWARRQKIAGVDERGRTLNPTIGQRILLELAFTSDVTGTSLLGQAALAAACLCGKRTVVSWLIALEKSGLLTRTNRALKAGGRTSDRITLTIGPNSAGRTLDREDANKSSDGQSAPGADWTPAKVRPAHRPKVRPAHSQSAPGAPFLLQINKNPSYSPLVMEIDMAIRDQLTDIGVQPETAETIMNSFAIAGTPLDADSVRNLVKILDGPNPQQQAVTLLEDGLRTLAGDRKRGLNNAQQSKSNTLKRRVNANLEPDLWRRCCQASGHRITLTTADGSWLFDADLVSTAEAAI